MYKRQILGASDSGKTHLAKAIGIAACQDFKVEYHHCESFLGNLVALKNADYVKYERKLKLLTKLDLLLSLIHILIYNFGLRLPFGLRFVL